MASFFNELIQQTWESVLKIDNANPAYDCFLHILMDIFNKHCTVKKFPQQFYENKKTGSPKV